MTLVGTVRVGLNDAVSLIADDDPRAAWNALVVRALRLAVHQEPGRARAVVERLVRDHGTDLLIPAMAIWVDIMLAYREARHPGLMPRFVNDVAGQDVAGQTDAGEVPPVVAWAGQLTAARANEDVARFETLCRAAPTGSGGTIGSVKALLLMCARNVRHTLVDGHAPQGVPMEWRIDIPT